MKQGDAVKVRIRNGANHSWRKGVVLGFREVEKHGQVVNVGHGEYSSYREQEFDTNDVKRLQEQTDEVYHANLMRDLPIGLALAQEALADLLPSETVILKPDDQTLSSYHGAVTIDPVQYEQETIGAFIERNGYQVTVWKYVHATRQQPEEYVDAPVGTFPTIGAAVQEFVKTIFALKSSDYWQAKADNAMAEAWAAGEM